mmetsp:Transcript_10399/g.28414  ORF Transcript_10399/g.28414 Transcript_10399/m.28414 type:complete len:215 (+) Transcript_10399:5257-5901(+)
MPALHLHGRPAKQLRLCWLNLLNRAVQVACEAHALLLNQGIGSCTRHPDDVQRAPLVLHLMHSDAHRHQHMAAVEEIDNYAGPAAAAGDDGGGLLQPLGVHGVVGRGQQGVQLGAHQLACAHAQQGRHVPSGKGDGAVRVAHHGHLIVPVVALDVPHKDALCLSAPQLHRDGAWHGGQVLAHEACCGLNSALGEILRAGSLALLVEGLSCRRVF